MSMTFNEFKDRATKILNLKLDGYKLNRVQRRTDSLMRRYNISNYDECLKRLEKDKDFRAAYLNHFTINTSEFFRNPENFSYLQKNIFPALFKSCSRIKIWSAPCSNGSEPYTLAIILAELKYKTNQYQILASDLDPNIIEVAKKGIYGLNSLQNVPDHLLHKYFTLLPGNANKYQLKESIISRVTFEIKDLINEPYPDDWDLILSRNFFIYLTKDFKEKLVQKFSAALKPGGYLFLGNTEFIFNPEKYGLKKVYSSFYQKIE